MTRWPWMERANLGAGDTGKWAGAGAGILTVDVAQGGSFAQEGKRAAERAIASGRRGVMVARRGSRDGLSVARASALVADTGRRLKLVKARAVVCGRV